VEITRRKANGGTSGSSEVLAYWGAIFAASEILNGVAGAAVHANVKKRTAVMAKLREFSGDMQQTVGRVIEMINPSLRGGELLAV